MDNLELVKMYWGRYFQDYLSCYDNETTIDESKLEEMILELLNNDYVWGEIDSVVYEILSSHNIMQ